MKTDRLWIVFAVGPLYFGLAALWLGHDLNWDLLNYHYYNPHALLTWRYELDIAPAQLQSYFNPLVDVPFYLLIRALPAWAVGFAAGAFQGLNFSLVFVITWIMVEHPNPLARGFIGLASAIVGCSAPAYLGELGTLVHDSTLSVLVLTAIMVLLRVIRSGSCPSTSKCYLPVAAAGFLMGAATALKLPNATFALGSALALPFVASLKGIRARIVLVYAAAGSAAGILLLAPWMWFLWDRLGNPLFPFFNDVFQSPAVAPIRFSDVRFKPGAFWEYLVWPLIFSGDSRRAWEANVQDFRFAMLWCAGFLYLLNAILRRFLPGWALRPRECSVIDRSAVDFLLIFTLLSFLLWMLQFSIYRYLTPLELIAPLVLGLLVARFDIPGRFLTGLLVVLGLATIIALHAPKQWRQSWDEKYFEVESSLIAEPDKTIVVMLGGAPMSYVIPELPGGIRFLRPEGNLSLREGDGLMEKIRSTLAAHGGPILVLYDVRDADVQLPDSLGRLGLAGGVEGCARLVTNVPDNLRLCTLASMPAIRPPISAPAASPKPMMR